MGENTEEGTGQILAGGSKDTSPTPFCVYGGVEKAFQNLSGGGMWPFFSSSEGNELKMAEQCCLNDFLLPQKGLAVPQGRKVCATQPPLASPQEAAPAIGRATWGPSLQLAAKPKCCPPVFQGMVAQLSSMAPLAGASGPPACLCCSASLHSQIFNHSRVLLSLTEGFIEDGVYQGGKEVSEASSLLAFLALTFYPRSPGPSHYLWLLTLDVTMSCSSPSRDVSCCGSFLLHIPVFHTPLSYPYREIQLCVFSTQHNEWYLGNDWVDRQMDRWWMDGWWVNGWIDRWTDGWGMDGSIPGFIRWTNESICSFHEIGAR